MKKHIVSLCAVMALPLVGCATPYQEMGLTGGVAAMQITSDTAQITARGNGYTDPDKIQQFAMRKAAQTTVDAGYDLFEIISTSDRSIHGSTGSAYGGNGYAFGSSWQTIKPGETFMIKMHHGEKPADAPGTWFDAHEVLNFIGASDKRDTRSCKEVNGKVECAGTH